MTILLFVAIGVGVRAHETGVAAAAGGARLRRRVRDRADLLPAHAYRGAVRQGRHAASLARRLRDRRCAVLACPSRRLCDRTASLLIAAAIVRAAVCRLGGVRLSAGDAAAQVSTTQHELRLAVVAARATQRTAPSAAPQSDRPRLVASRFAGAAAQISGSGVLRLHSRFLAGRDPRADCAIASTAPSRQSTAIICPVTSRAAASAATPSTSWRPPSPSCTVRAADRLAGTARRGASAARRRAMIRMPMRCIFIRAPAITSAGTTTPRTTPGAATRCCSASSIDSSCRLDYELHTREAAARRAERARCSCRPEGWCFSTATLCDIASRPSGAARSACR